METRIVYACGHGVGRTVLKIMEDVSKFQIHAAYHLC